MCDTIKLSFSKPLESANYIIQPDFSPIKFKCFHCDTEQHAANYMKQNLYIDDYISKYEEIVRSRCVNEACGVFNSIIGYYSNYSENTIEFKPNKPLDIHCHYNDFIDHFLIPLWSRMWQKQYPEIFKTCHYVGDDRVYESLPLGYNLYMKWINAIRANIKGYKFNKNAYDKAVREDDRYQVLKDIWDADDILKWSFRHINLPH